MILCHVTFQTEAKLSSNEQISCVFFCDWSIVRLDGSQTVEVNVIDVDLTM